MTSIFTLPQAAIAAARDRHLRLADLYARTRAQSLRLAAPLSPEDMTVQSMEDASPAKWHLAHTTWFFETFILAAHEPDFAPHDPSYGYLFNSYYEHVGARHARAARGLLTRPNVEAILAYRQAVDDRMTALIPALDPAGLDLLELGVHHEMQHQELLLMDLLHVFSFNPLCPAYNAGSPPPSPDMPERRWLAFPGGIRTIGHDGDGFAFDNEGPSHEVLLRPFKLGSTLVSNAEWRAFMEDGGYDTATLWLSDGWAKAQTEDWRAPLYWRKREDGWWRMTLHGLQPIDPNAPVCHISYYEADAFARWAEARLPTEAEWEFAAQAYPVAGHFMEDGRLLPQAPGDKTDPEKLHQLFGTLWEWTASAYSPYPGFRASSDAVGEYNGKFMINQMVLKGGACITPQAQLRRSYRNFFYPHQRWIFAGLRLARDA